jgi:integrase
LLDENYARIARVPREVADEYDHKREQELKNRKEVFTAEDIQKFYYAYKQNISEYPVVILFLLETGMRESEFASLRNSNIDFKQNIINIVETRSKRFINNEKNNGIEEYVKVPKNGESRFVVMSDLCRECVEYMQEQTKLHCLNNQDDLLYPTFRNGKRRSNATMRVGFNLVCDKMGIDRDVHLTKTG